VRGKGESTDGVRLGTGGLHAEAVEHGAHRELVPGRASDQGTLQSRTGSSTTAA
jgi:hypothetical protein